MFELRTVLALTLVCLQVSGTAQTVYDDLGKCFKENHEGFFHDFFPFHIAKLYVKTFDAVGAYVNVNLSGLENVDIRGQLIKGSEAVIQFNNTFSKITIKGYLEGCFNFTLYNGSITGYAKNLNMKGKVTYEAESRKVTALQMDITVEEVSTPFDKGESPFDDKRVTEFFNGVFIHDKKYIENQSIILINSKIDTSDKIAQVMKECKINV